MYLLDHEYTQRGLNWSRLKGPDAERVALLRAAAEQAGCESVLALAEVKQTWDASPAGEDPWDDYGYDEEDEDAEDECAAEDGDYELGDLVDDEITLSWWTAPDGKGGEAISLCIHDYESCTSTPSAELTPYESQYEGYMGNYATWELSSAETRRRSHVAQCGHDVPTSTSGTPASAIDQYLRIAGTRVRHGTAG